ncbi:MAG: XTP/dITP diphosphatase [Clostridia bacterium]|nr:XTP/dITP diphosphatase [Clostridia bacterium]
MELVLATNNKHKLTEIKSILGNSFSGILSLSEAGLNVDVEETGSTFEENAYLKASTVCKLSGKAALADDSGLEVVALGGAPGVYSARYAGEDQNDENNIKKLLSAMENETDRRASFTTVLCLCYPDGRTVYATGKTFGKILFEKSGDNGFGYDPVFYSDDLKKSFGEATAEEKNAVSHRSRALRSLLENNTL